MARHGGGIATAARSLTFAEHAEGTRRIYQLNDAGLSALRDQLDTFWDRALIRYQDVIDDSTKENT